MKNDHQRAKRIRIGKRAFVSTGFMAVSLALVGTSLTTPAEATAAVAPVQGGILTGNYVVLGYNDLGMHCMNDNFSDMCVLPPANTLMATVIKRGDGPDIVTENIRVSYSIPGNTTSFTKTDFWNFDLPLFGVNLPNDMGLFGYGLSGNMKITPTGDWAALGIPITPITDAGVFDPFQLSQINVYKNNNLVAATQAVVPVSTEMRCDSCHGTTRTPASLEILQWHDKLQGTRLVANRPVLCASCHADPALGAPGQPGISSLSLAMHKRHANKFNNVSNEKVCYSCHPGPQTQCLRDVHKSRGMTCVSCHGGMQAMSNPDRTPWKDQPKCGSCHNVQGHEYEEPGKLFKDSRGHNGVKCAACHGSPHAIAPSENPRDNLQAIALQGHAGTISKCTVCHTKTPEDPFNHTLHD